MNDKENKLTAQFKISAFGDEIAVNLEDQLQTLNTLNIHGIDLRATWGTNVLHLSDEEAQRVKSLCDEAEVEIVCLGSPIGKSPLADPIDKELANLDRLATIGKALSCRRIRIFSFYPEDISTNAHYDQYIEAVVERLTRLAERAQTHNLLLLLENEKEIVGDTVARCQALMQGVNHPNLRFLWDPANFVQVGDAAVTETGWPRLGEWTAYIHIKDAVLSDGSIRPAGEGDGQIDKLLQTLVMEGYQGMLALEPHLSVAGHSSGFSGAEGMTVAVNALRKVMGESGCQEVHALPPT